MLSLSTSWTNRIEDNEPYQSMRIYRGRAEEGVFPCCCRSLTVPHEDCRKISKNGERKNQITNSLSPPCAADTIVKALSFRFGNADKRNIGSSNLPLA